jgi:hypothetical protein
LRDRLGVLVKVLHRRWRPAMAPWTDGATFMSRSAISAFGTSIPPELAMPRRERLALLAVASAVASAALLGIPLAWSGGWELNHVAGAWVGLALDLSHGTFYRPLFGPEGFGGTRFMPLYFSLHAGLIQLFGHPIATGYALSLLSGAALLTGLYALLRTLGVARFESVACAALPLAGASAWSGLVTIRGDLLPVAFSLWGLVALLQGADRRWSTPVAALCFTLALGSKLSAGAGLAAGAMALFAGGERRRAIRLVLLVALGFAAAVVAVDLITRGRFLTVLATCAWGGGRWGGLVMAPIKLVGELVRQDPGGLCLVVLAAASLAFHGRGPILARLLWGVTLLQTLVIFASPGTGPNHLVDLEVASALVVALGLSDAGVGVAFRRAALVLLAGSAFLTAASHVQRAERTRPRDSRISAALAAAGETDRPLLSEDPLVPIAAGQTPWVLDPFMLRIARLRDPDLAAPLLAGLRSREFGAVILLEPLDPASLGWYEQEHFGPGFAEAVRARYVLFGRAGGYYIYLPRSDQKEAP